MVARNKSVLAPYDPLAVHITITYPISGAFSEAMNLAGPKAREERCLYSACFVDGIAAQQGKSEISIRLYSQRIQPGRA